jgi:fibronectin type 3 domain-containing protein
MKKIITGVVVLACLLTGGLALSQIESPLGSNDCKFGISWNPSPATDLAYYSIYRTETADPEGSMVLLTTTTLTTYNDVDLPAAVTFKYEVTATDTSGNESERSTAAQETTVDFVPPLKLNGLRLERIQ